MKSAVIYNLQALGVAYLRRGELENCTLNHNAEMCILPLSVHAQHKLPSSSQKAVEYFKRYLQLNPGNREVRWLMNVAYMTFGKHPIDVPKEYLIPSIGFRVKGKYRPLYGCCRLCRDRLCGECGRHDCG
ncbi:MAG: hypothetical protein WKF84_08955 [Pyrinomonadaceae bacterium]